MDRQPYRLETTERAMKEFLALPSPVQERLNAVVNHLAIDPRPRGCVKLETFKNAFRVRAGDYRVIVLEDCCGAFVQEEHEGAIRSLSHLVEISSAADFLESVR